MRPNKGFIMIKKLSQIGFWTPGRTDSKIRVRHFTIRLSRFMLKMYYPWKSFWRQEMIFLNIYVLNIKAHSRENLDMRYILNRLYRMIDVYNSLKSRGHNIYSSFQCSEGVFYFFAINKKEWYERFDQCLSTEWYCIITMLFKELLGIMKLKLILSNKHFFKIGKRICISKKMCSLMLYMCN